MHAGAWFWRLQFWQWQAAGRERPLRRVCSLLAWCLPCVAIPLLLRIVDARAAAAARDFLLSLDVLLTLAFAGLTVMDTLGAAARSGAEDWLWPRSFRPVRVRWLSRLRWLVVARWPAGLALIAGILGSGEMLLMATLALASGASLAWTLRSSVTAQKSSVTRPRRARGLAALSWVPFHEAFERFALRRALVLAIPALLAAPAGAQAAQVGQMVAVWLPLLFVVTVGREAARADGVLRVWLRAAPRTRLRLSYWVWRHVALGCVALAALCLLWTGSR